MLLLIVYVSLICKTFPNYYLKRSRIVKHEIKQPSIIKLFYCW